MHAQPLNNRSAEKLAEIVQRAVRVASPDHIILFGSAARREAGTDSDLDLLVVKFGQFHRGQLTEEIYLSLIGVGRAVDVMVVTPEDVERYRDSPVLVIAPALREGRVICAACAVATERDGKTASQVGKTSTLSPVTHDPVQPTGNS